jgi:hypothetical protein
MVWNSGCLCIAVHSILTIFDTLPESGRLAVIGVCLTVAALLLRRILLPSSTPLNGSSRADVALK